MGIFRSASTAGQRAGRAMLDGLAAGVATAPQPDTIGNIQRITAGQPRWWDMNPVTGETWDDYDERRGDDHG